MTAVIAKGAVAPIATFNAFSSGNSARKWSEFPRSQNSLNCHFIEGYGTLILSKLCAGFDRSTMDFLTPLYGSIRGNVIPGLKYLIFDFAHPEERKTNERPQAFDDLIYANENLILKAPVISVAWARSNMRGADLEFAFSCSMIVASHGARFYFDGDASIQFALYTALARKIGFVKAERLLESESSLSAEEVYGLSLAKRVFKNHEKLSGVEEFLELAEFLKEITRRYNALTGIFRAQRIISHYETRPGPALDLHLERVLA
jgi:enoyl-CoA hydratase/carnithine racemase